MSGAARALAPQRCFGRALCMLLAFTCAAGAFAAHGYGTRPPWVAAGAVRALAPAGDVYLEVLIQQRGHLGARGPRTAPDTFRLVQVAAPGAVAATPRWRREPLRRPLAEGERTLAGGALDRAPVALAVAPRGTGFAVADHLALTLYSADGAPRLTLALDALFGAAAPGEEHPRTALWPFAWLAAPPRALALWWPLDDTLAVARRGADGAWHSAAFAAADGALLPAEAAQRVLTEALAAPAAPEASIALEVLAEGALRSGAGTPEWGAVRAAAAALSARGAGTLEGQLFAAFLVGDTEALLAPLRRGDGHPSMDDLLAAALLTELARAGAAPPVARHAFELVELALARGVPELFPAVAALGPRGAAALAEAWVAVRAGRLSPYADGRAAEAQLLALLMEVLGLSAAPLVEWLGEGPAERAVLVTELLAAEPPTQGGAWPTPDPRAALVRAAGPTQGAALAVTGSATRELVGALCAALQEAQAAGRTAAARSAARSLARIVDLPPEGALELAEEPARAADLWRAWWSAHGERPQAAELAALAAADAGAAQAPFGTPLPGLGAALAALLRSPEGARWRVLAEGLGRELEHLDALGLRAALEAALRMDAGVALAPAERAARDALEAALGRVETERAASNR